MPSMAIQFPRQEVQSLPFFFKAFNSEILLLLGMIFGFHDATLVVILSLLSPQPLRCWCSLESHKYLQPRLSTHTHSLGQRESYNQQPTNSLYLYVNRYLQKQFSFPIPLTPNLPVFPYHSDITVQLMTQLRNVKVTVTSYLSFTRNTANFTYYTLFKLVSFPLLLLSQFSSPSAHV